MTMVKDRSKQPDQDRARQGLRQLQRPAESAKSGSLEQQTVHRELDVTGEVCPHPVEAAQEALASMESGAVLREVTDHSISTHTVPAAMERSGMAEVLGIDEPEPGLYRIYLRRK